jgi:hypothetical protein
MTPLQQAYLSKLHATAAANLEFFKKNMPEVHRLVVRENPLSTLDISDQGDLTIRNPDGTAQAIAPYIVAAEKHFAEFAHPDSRPQLLAFHSLRAVHEEPSHGDMQRYHYSNLDAEFPNRARRHFAEHYPDNKGLHPYPVFGESSIPLLIVLGSCAGIHLERLLLQYRIRHLIIIDVDVDAFRLSTFFQDYVLLSRLALEKGTTLSFIVEPEIESVARHLMNVLRQDLPPFFIHGAALYYAMSDDQTLEAIKASVIDTLWQMFFGLGYFDDELISISHTFENLLTRIPVYTKPNVVSDDAVAFIIGSGPSLDGLLPLLREYRDRAVLFSCGTSLGALAHAGIQPDFHVEKERPRIVYEVLTRTVEPEFLKGIDFIGLNVVHPDVFPLFRSARMALKEADTMGLLMDQEGTVARPPLDTQPTVTNTALSIATSLGFKRIYLIGVDLGFKEKARHHSQHTAYLQKMPEAEHLRRLLSKTQASDQIVPGNFGGEVITTKILEMARLHMESVITHYPAVQVFNLNDGAYIKGAIPLEAKDFSIEISAETKWQVTAAVREAFQEREFDIRALKQRLLGQVDEFIQSVETILSGEQTDKEIVIDKISMLYKYMFSDAVKRAPLFPLFRGTVLHLASLAHNALSIIVDEEEAAAKAVYDFENLKDFLAQARTEIVSVLGESTILNSIH